MKRSKITLLHISDLHIDSIPSGRKATQEVVFDGFWEFVKGWKTPHGLRSPDFIIVTGDIARRGVTAEYSNENDEGGGNPMTASSFLASLCQEFKLGHDRVILTPGNHDADRGQVNQYSARGHLDIRLTEDRLADFFFDPGQQGQRDEIFRRLRPFCSFYADFLGTKLPNEPNSLVEFLYEPRRWTTKHHIPLPVTIFPFCTPWLSQSYYHAFKNDEAFKAMDESEPEGWVAIGLPWIHKLLTSQTIQTNELVIAALHHPLSWVVDWERKPASELLGRVCDLVFTGHIHRGEVFIPQLSCKGHTIGAGAFYLHINHRNSFNILDVCIEDGRATHAELRKAEWHATDREWKLEPFSRNLGRDHLALGYSITDNSLRIPMQGKNVSAAPRRTIVKLVLLHRGTHARMQNLLAKMITGMSQDPNCRLLETSQDGLQIIIELDANKSINLRNTLSEDREECSIAFSPFAVESIYVGSKRYDVRPASELVVQGRNDERHPRLSAEQIAENFHKGESVLWRNAQESLEELFQVRNQEDLLAGHRTVIDPDSQEPLCEALGEPSTPPAAELTTFPNPRSGESKSSDWGWYCRRRYSPTNSFNIDAPEHELNRLLRLPVTKGTKKVLLVYGGTGHGKTTFLRYFFRKYLPDHDSQLAQHLVVARLSLGIAGMTLQSLEDDVDNRINGYLNTCFPFLYEETHMLAMAEMAATTDTEFFNKLRQEVSLGETKEQKLQWINAFFGRRSVQPECNNPFADFNRVRISYLTSKFGLKFILILDNIDQMPRAVQEAAFMLARHKLEWVQDVNDVTVILAMRPYLLSRAAKELPLAAYQNRYEIPIFPCRIRDVLRKRLRYVVTKLPDEVVFRDASMFDKAGATVTLSKKALFHVLWRWFTSLSSVETALSLDRLTNRDIREQLKMIRTILRSPNYDWLTLGDAVVKGQATRPISQSKIVDMLLRGTNAICETQSPDFFLNLFDTGGHRHFANTLNRVYILRLMKYLEVADIDHIASLLAELGHPPCWTKKNIEAMLQANILISLEGQYLGEDKVRTVYFRFEGSTLATVYSDVLIYELYYLQAMAYQTPCHPEFESRIVLPIAFNQDVRLFVDRLGAALQLIRQINRDEETQKETLAQSPAAKKVLVDFGLIGIAAEIIKRTREQLIRLEESGAYAGLYWGLIHSSFSL
jgi:hypothetical protein